MKLKVTRFVFLMMLFCSCTHYEPAKAIITYTDGSKEIFFGEQEVYNDGSWHQGLYADNGCLVSSGFINYSGQRCGVRKVEIQLLKK
jgi:hypothetical protein